ncbi:MAG: hypothetical protein RJA81_1951 [Planctomycetota bacterium]|jgi:hypothetical protein
MMTPGSSIRAILAILTLNIVISDSSRLIAADAVSTKPTLAPSISRDRKVIARCGQGFLEEVGGHKVLHVKGSPYEMGYQHGALLKSNVHEMVRFLLDVKSKEITFEWNGIKFLNPRKVIAGIQATQKKFIPQWYFDELQGLADGSGVPLEDVIACNFIPELFHCSGFAISGSATKDGQLYHGRVLDYGCDWRLQEHPVLLVARPDGKVPFLNVTYAGFIGSVTGMNAEKVSLGEMGGRGLGKWQGVPMAVLMRWALQEARTLEEAVAIFRDNPRTCEYYYVIADGKSGKGVGMEAGADRFQTVEMGQTHELLPHSVKDAVLLSAGDRYELLVSRVKELHGQIDAAGAISLMSRPVAMKSNLHNVLFETSTTRFWVSHAGKDGTPAAEQPYLGFQFLELLGHEPTGETPQIQGPSSDAALKRASAEK